MNELTLNSERKNKDNELDELIDQLIDKLIEICPEFDFVACNSCCFKTKKSVKFVCDYIDKYDSDAYDDYKIDGYDLMSNICALTTTLSDAEQNGEITDD